MRKIEAHRRLLDLVRGLDQITVQNRLMSAPDKDLALAMLYMTGFERDQILRRLSRQKRMRIHEELKRQEHTRILYDQYDRSIEWVIRHISTDRRPERQRSYFRPSRRSGGGRA